MAEHYTLREWRDGDQTYWQLWGDLQQPWPGYCTGDLIDSCFIGETAELAGVGGAWLAPDYTEITPTACKCVQCWIKSQLVNVLADSDNPAPHEALCSCAPCQPSRVVSVRQDGSAAARGFCIPPSGRELTQHTGQCRGRTHVPMALYQPPAPWPCRRDHNEQACRPIYPSGPRHGRLEVECGRSAGGSPPTPGMAERNQSGASGAGHAKFVFYRPRKQNPPRATKARGVRMAAASGWRNYKSPT